jgi:hypothetical protein
VKTYELVTVPPEPERLEMKAIAVVCDLCGFKIKQLRKDGSAILNPIMRERFGDAVEVSVSMKAGEHNLDGGIGQTISFDICPGCFEEQLQPWLEQQGAEPKVESWHT